MENERNNLAASYDAALKEILEWRSKVGVLIEERDAAIKERDELHRILTEMLESDK